jgi:predicted nucleic acid-binding protein
VVIVIVVDASVVVTALSDDGESGDQARRRLRGESVAAPEILDLEVVSVLRRLSAVGRVPVRRAELALRDLADSPIRRSPHRPLLVRCWELRDDVTAYDAAYVALAELLGCRLLTGDRQLSRTPGLRCPVEVLPPTS